MEQIIGINHVGIRVTDLAQSRDFYAQLGFEFLGGPMGPEPVAIMEHPSGVNINFILNSNDTETLNRLMDVPEKHTGFTHMAIEVTDLGYDVTPEKFVEAIKNVNPQILGMSALL